MLLVEMFCQLDACIRIHERGGVHRFVLVMKVMSVSFFICNQVSKWPLNGCRWFWAL